MQILNFYSKFKFHTEAVSYIFDLVARPRACN